MKKLAVLIPVLLLFALPALAYGEDYYDYDDESISNSEALKLTFYCGLVALAGYLIQQIKALRGLGTLILGIGGFFGACGIFVIVMNILTEIVNVAVKAALILGAIALGLYILYSIYKAIADKINS